MTRAQFEAKLTTLGYQVFYNHTTQKDVVNLPFILYLDSSTTNYNADNKVFQKIINYSVIVHSVDRDETLEASLETLFNTEHIPYEVNNIDWDDELMMWIVSYNVQLYG